MQHSQDVKQEVGLPDLLQNQPEEQEPVTSITGRIAVNLVTKDRSLILLLMAKSPLQ